MPVDPATVKDILVAANKAVKDAAVPAKFQEVAYAKAVDLLAGTGIASAVPPPDPGAKGKEKEKPEEPAVGGPSLDKIAEKLKVDRAVVREAYHTDGDALNLSFGASQLADSKKEATRQIALLIASGRQAGGWDSEWTATKTIRAVCEEFGAFDSANFAVTLTAMSRVFGFSGKGQGRKVKVNRKGYEEAADLVRELVGGDGT